MDDSCRAPGLVTRYSLQAHVTPRSLTKSDVDRRRAFETLNGAGWASICSDVPLTMPRMGPESSFWKLQRRIRDVVESKARHPAGDPNLENPDGETDNGNKNTRRSVSEITKDGTFFRMVTWCPGLSRCRIRVSSPLSHSQRQVAEARGADRGRAVHQSLRLAQRKTAKSTHLCKACRCKACAPASANQKSVSSKATRQTRQISLPPTKTFPNELASQLNRTDFLLVRGVHCL